MSDNSYDQLIQRKKWREAKAAWRAKVKNNPPKENRDDRARRHPRAKFALEEEGSVFLDYLLGDSYRLLANKYSISERTVYKILLHWKGLYNSRFSDSSVVEPEELQSEELVENSQGGFF